MQDEEDTPSAAALPLGAAHHCSQLSRYQLPTTFFTTSSSKSVAQTPQIKSRRGGLEDEVRARPGLVSASLDGAGGGARRVLKLTMDEEEEKNVGELEEEVKKEEEEVE